MKSALLTFFLFSSIISALAQAGDTDPLVYDAKQGTYLAPSQSLCGVMSLCAVLREFKMPYDVDEIARLTKVDFSGCTMEMLLETAKIKELHPTSQWQKPEEIRAYLNRHSNTAVIIHESKEKHVFAVLGKSGNQFKVCSFPRLFLDDLTKLEPNTKYAVLYLSPTGSFSYTLPLTLFVFCGVVLGVATRKKWLR